jgi:hypothetical protein
MIQNTHERHKKNFAIGFRTEEESSQMISFLPNVYQSFRTELPN